MTTVLQFGRDESGDGDQSPLQRIATALETKQDVAEVSHRVNVAMAILDRLHTHPSVIVGAAEEMSVMRMECEDELLESACVFLQDYLRVSFKKEVGSP